MTVYPYDDKRMNIIKELDESWGEKLEENSIAIIISDDDINSIKELKKAKLYTKEIEALFNL